MQKTDVLVIGSGIAGLYFALKCAEFCEVVLATKDRLENSNTARAQGGIAAVLGLADTPGDHIRDTLNAGDGLCDENAVKFMVYAGQGAVLDLEDMGVPFNEKENGWLHLALEGGHSHARVAHVSDHTGASVVSVLIDKVKNHPSITVLENFFATDLWVDAGTCHGAFFITENGEEIIPFAASYTLLATGGAGRVYSRNTNPHGATGDGFAMAWRAGAVMHNMEFVQFHPTMLYAGGDENFLISEAVRGFGTQLVNARGKTFMEKYHPMGSLAPRDSVSRAIINQMGETKSPCVYLDTPRLDAQQLTRQFPGIYKKCLEAGIDITQQPIPVAPAAHYICGGVASNLSGETNIPGLMVCGETACTGVHGANRLASNSLLEGLVFAKAAAIKVQSGIGPTVVETLPTVPPAVMTSIAVNGEVAEIRRLLPRLMWEKAGIIRNGEQLGQALEQVEAWENAIEGSIKDRGINRFLMETLNMVQTSRLIIMVALWREESRGVHYRDDFPRRIDNFAQPSKHQHNLDGTKLFPEFIK